MQKPYIEPNIFGLILCIQNFRMQTHKRRMKTITTLWKTTNWERSEERQNEWKEKIWNFPEYQFQFWRMTLWLISFFLLLLLLLIKRVSFARFRRPLLWSLCMQTVLCIPCWRRWLCTSNMCACRWLNIELFNGWKKASFIFYFLFTFFHLPLLQCAQCSMFNVFDIPYFILGANTLLICRTEFVHMPNRERMLCMVSRRRTL